MTRRTREVDWLAPEGIGRRGMRGGILLASGSWVRFVLQLAASIVLARILGPAEYGLAAVLIVFGAASELLRDSGAATLVTQDRTMDHRQVTGLFWRSALVGLAAAVVVALTGLPLAALFGEPRFVYFAPMMSVMFLATGLAAIPGAVSARNLRFVPGALSDVCAAVTGAVVGVAAAVGGAGALALVLQSVTFVTVQSAIVWFLCPWRPGRPRRGVLNRLHANEAAHLTTVQVLNYVVTNVDNLLVGLVAGVRQAGLYNQAYRLMVLPLQQVLGPVQRVVLPAMSLLRGDPPRLAELYSRLVLGSTLVLWTLFGVAAEEARLIVLLVFGRSWLESAPIFQVLAIGGLTQAIGYTTTWMFIASRRPRLFARWSIATRTGTVLVLLAGLPWGAVGVAWAFAAAVVVLVVPEFLLATRGSGVRIGHLLRAVAWPSVCVLGVVLVGTMVHRLGAETTWLDLAAHVAAEVVPACLVVLLVPRVRGVVLDGARVALRRARPGLGMGVPA